MPLGPGDLGTAVSSGVEEGPVPVLIVGGGVTGLVSALLLARLGVRSLVFERYHEPYPLPRAVHLDDEAVRILQQLDLDAEFTRISRPAAGLRLLNARHRVIAEFRRDRLAGPHGHPQSNLFDQPDLERLLRTRAAAEPLVDLRTGVEVISATQPPHPSPPNLSSSDPAPPGGSPTSACLSQLPLARVGYVASSGMASSALARGDAAGRGVPGAGVVGGGVPGGQLPGGDAAGAREVEAAVVLACDGAESGVRKGLGVGLEDLGFSQRWLVVDIRSAEPLPVWDGVDQICDPRRAVTAMRIGPDRYRWEFRMLPGESAADLSAPESLSRLLAPWTHPARPDLLTGSTPSTGGKPVSRPDRDMAGGWEVVRAAEYVFRARLARRWRVGRVFLLGDAAHQTPPFIGQGLAGGLRDAHNLAWKVARLLTCPATTDPELRPGPAADRVLPTGPATDRELPTGPATDRALPTRPEVADGGLPSCSEGAGNRLLDGGVDLGCGGVADSYGAERRPHTRELIRLAVLTGVAMTGGGGRAAAVRRVVLACLCRLPGFTALILGRTGPRLRKGPLVGRHRLGGRPVPQPWVRVPGGDGAVRLDAVLGSGFVLLVRAEPAPWLRRLAERVEASEVWLAPNENSSAGEGSGRMLVDAPQVRDWLAAYRTRAVLVRPDRVVLTGS